MLHYQGGVHLPDRTLPQTILAETTLSFVFVRAINAPKNTTEYPKAVVIFIGYSVGRVMILTARLWMASSLPSKVSEAAIHTDETYSILDLTMFL